MRGGLCLGVLVCLLVPTCVLAQKTPEQHLEEAESLVRQQQLEQAVQELTPLLYPAPRLQHIDDVHRARELLGASYWLLKKTAKAEKEWQFLLIARPGFQLDEFLYPKKMRAFLDTVRNTLLRQGVIKSAVQTPEKQPIPTVLRVTQIIEQNNRSTAFMPFGAGQFATGNSKWGWFFMSTQTAAAVAVLASSVGMQVLPGYPYDMDSSNTARYNSLRLISLVSGAVFVSLYIWGVIDANVNYVLSRVVKTERTLIKERTADIGPPQPGKVEAYPAPAAGGSR